MREDLSDTEMLYLVTGHVAVQWAILEHALDLCCAMSFHTIGGDSIRDDIPRSLEQKTDFLKKSFKRLPPLAQLRDKGVALFIDINNFAQKRHDHIHGVVQRFEAIDGKFKLFRTVYAKTMHSSKEVVVDLNQFPNVAASIEDLQSRTLDLAREMLALIPPEFQK